VTPQESGHFRNASTPETPILAGMASSDWPKVCACGAVWSEVAWRSRPLVGQMALSDDEPPLELRHCTCGSTIAVTMTRPVSE
jgi:hypothetical protein